MKQKITITLSIIFAATIIFFACQDEELPKVTGINKIELTLTEDSISYLFAQLQCDLNQNSKFVIEQYGFCWDTVANVTIEKEHNSFEELSSESFEENIENLLPNKTYYVKAYIQNGDVIIYSNELTIHTLDARPVVTTNDITNILANSAQASGEVEAYEALFPITQRGVCWANTQNPTIADSLTINGTGNGSFTSHLQNLDIGATYYVRAYAINSEGINYGEEKNFTTLDGIPELTTDSIKNITATSATFYGNIIENDVLEILEKGFCWSTSTNPTITNNFKIVSGNELGSFNSEITDMDVNTTFYVKAYLKNEAGTFYGDEISFTTEDGLPSGLNTTAISDITTTTATSGGNITDDGGFEITARGVCWSTNTNPTITDSYTTDGTGTGNFTSSLTGLTELTNYYVRVYATNANGTSYGNEISFTAKGFLTDYDGNVYKTVKIGNQIWMAENLKVTHYADGTAIPLVESSTSWDALGYTDKAMCYYDNSTTNADTYGALYTWSAAMNSDTSSTANPSGIQGACPDGWHLPSDAEWTELVNFIADDGYSDQEGTALKSITGWYNDGNGTDNYGFRTLPAGYRQYYGTFYNLSHYATFWSATEYYDSDAWYRRLYYNYSDVRRYDINKNFGSSVRCVKD